MGEVVALSLVLHKYFVFAMFVFATLNFLLVLISKEHNDLVKRLLWFGPIYHVLFYAVVFMGIILSISLDFQISHAAYLMIVFAIFMLFMSIYQVKAKRNAKSVAGALRFRKIALIRYFVDILFILIMFILIYF